MKTSALGLPLRSKPCFRVFLPAVALWGLAASPLAAAPTGQFWWCGEGNPTDARIAYANNDGGAQTVNTDNSPTVDLVTAFPQELGLDTAAGFYFAIVNGGGGLGTNARLVRGPIGGAAAVTVVVTFPNDLIVNALQVDAINKKIYTTWQDGAGAANNTGIRVYSYNPATGATTDLGFLTRADVDGTKPISGSGYDLLDVRDFALDPSTNTLYFTELLTGVQEMGIYRMDLTSKIITQMVSSAQFPDSGSGGYIIDVEVDPTTDKVYFTTESQYPFGTPEYNAAFNKLWVVPQGAANATATAVTLSGLPAGSHIFPGDMIFDQSQRQLYIESEESNSISTDDVIYVFQLDAAGTTATLVRTITPSPAFDNSAANIQGMAFDAFATLTMTGNTTHAFEQSIGVSLLAADPVITDIDGGYLASATVAISGSFVGSGDDLFVLDGAIHRNSGVVAGTSITVARTTDGSGNQKLTLTGYDTLAHYQQVLGDVQLLANGDNPTNFGSNGSRTITWQINDGAAGNPAMALNAASTNLRTTSFTVEGVNDAPVNVKPADKSLNEGGSLVIAGFSISDIDASAASSLTTTLSVGNGTLTVASAGGAAVGGNGTATVTLTGTVAQINTTLAAAGNVLYTPAPNFSGSDSLVILTNDGGNTGTPGAQTDSDSVGITVIGQNDEPTLNAIPNPAAIAEDAGQQTVNLSGISEGPANESSQTLTITAVSSNTAVIPDPSVSFTEGNTTGSLSYTPVANASGSAIITVTVTDSGGTANGGDNVIQRTFTVTVTPVNDAPSAGADSLASVAEDSGTRLIALATLLANDGKGPADESGQVLSITAVSTPTGGTVAINGANVEFTPAANFNGAAGFSYTVTDNGTTNGVNDFKSANGNVTFAITAVNDNPGAGNDTILRYAAQATNVRTGVLLSNDSDVDGDSVSFVSAGAAAHGTVGVVGDRLYYTPNAGYTGGDSFTYTINDGHGGSATGTVTVTVIPGEETAKIESLPGGAWKVSFTGIAGMSYRIQSSDTLAAGSWVDRGTVAADDLGEFSFTDSIPLPARRFYRCTAP